MTFNRQLKKKKKNRNSQRETGLVSRFPGEVDLRSTATCDHPLLLFHFLVSFKMTRFGFLSLALLSLQAFAGVGFAAVRSSDPELVFLFLLACLLAEGKLNLLMRALFVNRIPRRPRRQRLGMSPSRRRLPSRPLRSSVSSSSTVVQPRR